MSQSVHKVRKQQRVLRLGATWKWRYFLPRRRRPVSVQTPRRRPRLVQRWDVRACSQRPHTGSLQGKVHDTRSSAKASRAASSGLAGVTFYGWPSRSWPQATLWQTIPLTNHALPTCGLVLPISRRFSARRRSKWIKSIQRARHQPPSAVLLAGAGRGRRRPRCAGPGIKVPESLARYGAALLHCCVSSPRQLAG